MHVVIVIVIVIVRLPATRAQVPAQHPGADQHHEQPGGEREPRVQVLRQDPRRQPERHEPEREDARRVRDRHRQPQHHRVGGRAARAHEVGRDHALPVTGRERVQRAPPGRGQQEQHEHAATGGGVGEELGEAVLRAPLRRRLKAAAVRPRRDDRPVAGSDGERCAALVRRTGQQRLRVLPQPVRGIVGGDGRSHGRPATGTHHDRAPSHAVRIRRVAQLHATRVRRGGAQVELDPRGPQAALAGVEGRAGRARRARSGAARPSTRSRSAAADGGARIGEQRRAIAAALLERRDLRAVEDPRDPHVVRGDPHDVQAVHGEVAERMRGGDRGQRGEGRERGDRDGEDQPPHSARSSAARPCGTPRRQRVGALQRGPDPPLGEAVLAGGVRRARGVLEHRRLAPSRRERAAAPSAAPRPRCRPPCARPRARRPSARSAPAPSRRAPARQRGGRRRARPRRARGRRRCSRPRRRAGAPGRRRARASRVPPPPCRRPAASRPARRRTRAAGGAPRRAAAARSQAPGARRRRRRARRPACAGACPGKTASASRYARSAAAGRPRRSSRSPSSVPTYATFSAAPDPALTARRIASVAPGRSPSSSRR